MAEIFDYLIVNDEQLAQLKETVTFSVTLAHAHKWLARMKAQLSEMSDDSANFNVDLSKDNLDLASPASEIIDKVVQDFNDKTFNFGLYCVLERDLLNLKNVIYTSNANNGISKILSSIDQLNSIRRKYMKFTSKTNLLAKSTLTESDIAYLSTRTSSLDSPNSLIFNKVTNVDYSTKANSIRQIVEKLEVKRDELNSRTKVEVVVSKQVATLLGLE